MSSSDRVNIEAQVVGQKQPAKLPNTAQKLKITTYSGKVVTVNEGSIVRNLIAAAKVLKDEIVIVKAIFLKSDLKEYDERYENKRKTSANRIRFMKVEHNSGAWITRYPNFYVDSDGNICDGGHACRSMLASDKEVFVVWCTLGIDPAMNTKIDDIKLRNATQQAGYFPELYQAIDSNANVRASFVSTLKFVFERYCRATGFLADHVASVAKDKIVQLNEGRQFWQAAKPHFVEMVERVRKSENHSFTKAHFFVVGLILYMSGYAKWAASLATGSGIQEGSLLNRCRNYLIDNCNPNRPDFRDARVVKDVVENALAYLYAEANDVEFRAPQIRKQLIKRGDQAGQYRMLKLSKKVIEEDNQYRRQIIDFFVKKIAIETDSESSAANKEAA